MPHQLEELTAKAHALPPAERVRLAEDLLASVQHPDGEIEAAWDHEIQMRIAQVDAGAAGLIPSDDVFAQIRRLLK